MAYDKPWHSCEDMIFPFGLPVKYGILVLYRFSLLE